MKGYVLLIDIFSYMCVCVYLYIWNLNFHKENSNTQIFHIIHLTNEYSPTLYHYYNLSLYIYTHTHTHIYIYIYNNPSLGCNNICLI